MIIKPFFQCLALATISCCIVIVTLLTIHVAIQFVDLATGYVGDINRLIQQKILY